MLLSVMTTLKKSLLCLVAGFFTQLILFFIAIGLAELNVDAVWLWNMLLPGVPLFASGPHSTNPLSGLFVTMAFNTGVYAVLIFALHSLLKKMPTRRVFNKREA